MRRRQAPPGGARRRALRQRGGEEHVLRILVHRAANLFFLFSPAGRRLAAPEPRKAFRHLGKNFGEGSFGK